MASSARVETEVAPTFEKVTESGYLDLLIRRLHDEAPLTWIAQARDILEPEIKPLMTLLDVGCATGYAAKLFPELDYLGVDVEEAYLQIGRKYFAKNSRVNFVSHDVMKTPIDEPRDFVILNAVLEHCPTLNPALDNLIASARKVVLIRTFLGESEQIRTVPSPKPAFADTVRKFSNQYSFLDVFETLERHGFEGEIIRDRYTDSLPRYVDGSMRAFYFVKAKRRVTN
ncbi:MAG TPA: class I SAM-dependent methyltransferase [Pyrinomonadaceae bacterium]|nr:class I SAM-dependent methyltransferase [Pyrinomonadaceae bacterium]